MFPNVLAENMAFSKGGIITFPAREPRAVGCGVSLCTRITLRGGHYLDLPDSATVPTLRASRRVRDIAPGQPLPAPCDHPSAKRTADVPFDYTVTNNAGNSRRVTGTRHVTDEEAELLGWLVGDGSIHSPDQSLRFANDSAAILQRVQSLCSKAFPNVSVKWYAKLRGYDLTLTGGIDNPLRHFLRQMDFYECCPMAVGTYFSRHQIKCFLRGLWGADGWMYVRKGGNDVCFGLSRTDNPYYYSWLRLLHAGLGLQGSREVNKLGTSRIVFNGYVNYATFMREVGQIGMLSMPAVPVRQSRPANETYLANAGETWYDAPVQKVERLPQPVSLYHI